MTLSIERRGALWRDRTAIVDVSEDRLYAPAETVDERRYSYVDLAALSEHAAGALAATGVGTGDTVCVLSRNRVAVVALFFACRRLGATFAPISHRLTPANVGRPLDRLDPTIVVHESAQRDLVREVPPSQSATFEDLADADVDPDGSEAAARFDGARAEGEDTAPALALHGDSGTPIATFTADAVERNCVAAATTWGFGRGDRSPLVVPLSTYDGLLRVALPMVYAGGTLLVDRAFDPGDTLAAIDREEATFLAGRTAEFRELAKADDGPLSSIEWAVSETPVPDEVADAFLERGIEFTRASGRLECPNAFGAIERDPAAIGADVGGPVLDCDARLVDADDVVSGPGEGVLELSGPVLASGYATAADAESGSAAGEASDGDGDDDRGRFVDGRFVTGERFRRDEDGSYRPVE